MPEIRRDQQWFMQDGEPPYTARMSLRWLQDHFEDRVISNKLDIRWAPHSPDLNLLDFYLWGRLKSLVYQSQINDMDELKAAITAACQIVAAEECTRVIAHVRRRIT